MSRYRFGAFIILAVILLSVLIIRSDISPFTQSSSHNLSPIENHANKETPRPQEGPVKALEPILPGFPIDINAATKEDLALLPGIGPKTAERIIEKRKELGGFNSVDQLTAVKWIGKVKLGKIRNLVTVRPASGEAGQKVLPKQ